MAVEPRNDDRYYHLPPTRGVCARIPATLCLDIPDRPEVAPKWKLSTDGSPGRHAVEQSAA